MASELKYTNELKNLIHQQVNEPNAEFVRFFTRSIYTGVVTQKVLDQFTVLLRHSFTHYINDLITDRLKSALQKEEEIVVDTVPSIVSQGNSEPQITTTQEELEAYYIVKAILRDKIGSTRIVLRDAQTYCAILLDDNNRKPLCRLYFNGTRKFIATFDSEKKEVRSNITSVDDIYGYSNLLLATLNNYLEPKAVGQPEQSS